MQESETPLDLEHGAEVSIWPFIVGMSVLLVMLGFMTAFQWKLPVAGMVVGGVGAALVLVGIFGWVNEVFAQKGEAGLSPTAIVIFILSETALFGGLFGGYLYNMFSLGTWLPENTPHGVPPLTTAFILSVFLISSSFTMQIAESKLERGNAGGFKGWLLATMVLGGLFIAGMATEWTKLIGEGFTVSTNAFGTFFYTITGMHGSHVLVGLTLMLILMTLAVRGKIGKKRQSIVKAAGYYWHFVDIVWLLVLSLIYVLPNY